MSIINEFDFDNSKLSIGLMNSVDKDIGNTKQIKHTDIFSQWQGLIIDNEYCQLVQELLIMISLVPIQLTTLTWARDLSSNI